MNKIFTYALLVLSLIFNLIFGFKILKPNTGLTIKQSKQKEVQVLRIIDGDTFMTTDNQYVRLAGIDTPEFPNSCLSTEAKDKLESLINNKKVILKNISTDHFGRTLGFVFLDNVLIDKTLLSDGLGTSQIKSTQFDPELLKAESEAKTLKNGIWGPKCLPSSDCLIKGNYRQSDNTKIYHLPQCYNYQKVTVDLNKGDKWFCTETEATAVGFVKSKDCPIR